MARLVLVKHPLVCPWAGMSLQSSSPALRDVHNVCSWDEKAAQKIQKALEEEILSFTKDVQFVSTL